MVFAGEDDRSPKAEKSMRIIESLMNDQKINRKKNAK